MSENQTYEIGEYNGVAAALNSIEAKYAGRVYDVVTREGMADAKVARREIREARTGLERLRKEIKAPAWRRCQLIDSEAKEITRRLVAIESPIDEMIKAEEQRVANEKAEAERREALRVATIRERIEAFNVMPPWGSSSAVIMERLRAVSDLPIDDTFQEFTEAAAIAKSQAMSRLTSLHAEAKAVEDEQEKLRVENARIQAEMDAQRKANEARLAEEREAREKAEAEAERARNEERERMAAEARAARQKQEEAEKKAEAERIAAFEAAEKAAHEAELMAARCDNAEKALESIGDLVAQWLSDQLAAEDAMDKISIIVEANL